MEEYLVAEKNAQSEFVEKKSRFITFVSCVENAEQAEKFIKQMRDRYPDARHVCYAYRTYAPFCEKCSDDGEPKGTAGRPMLGVLQKAQVYDICVVVVRYFGGILLGANALGRAYVRGCADGVAAAGASMKKPAVRFDIVLPYHLYDLFLLRASAFEVRFERRDFVQAAHISLLLPKRQRAKFEEMLCRLSAGGAEIRITEGIHACF